MKEIFQAAKAASYKIVNVDGELRAKFLKTLADEIISHKDEILKANKIDLSRMDKESPMYDRLLLNESRIESISSDMKNVSTLPDPVGRIIADRTITNGLHIRKISVPYGVIGVIFEARPNVTFDVFSLCFRSGNVCLLKGGRDAENTNITSVGIIRDCLTKAGLDADYLQLLPSTHEAASELLNAVGLVDLVIPRGGRRLIDSVRENARVPYIETGAGVVHEYFDKDGDLSIGIRTVTNAKTRRVSVCNALDCLLVNRSRLNDLPELCSKLAEKNVELRCDGESYNALTNNYPTALLKKANLDDYGTEFLSYRMAIKVVEDVDEAISHINTFGSGHSESIITNNADTAKKFQREVDAACVYVNAPTSFTDGAQFGLGAEIGISTQKLGARGPMGLEELTTYKWLIDGKGQIRS